jgi:mannose-6-phosphate isomerase-like protein (cupin superfamily)
VARCGGSHSTPFVPQGVPPNEIKRNEIVVFNQEYAMKIVRFADRSFTPASHENPLAPGVLKKVLLEKADLQPGRIQMVNWASLGIGKQFAPHYHEDMQEIFILVEGEAEITVAAKTDVMRQGDTVVIDPREVHRMRNIGSVSVEYLAIGITGEAGGRTVVVDE